RPLRSLPEGIKLAYIYPGLPRIYHPLPRHSLHLPDNWVCFPVMKLFEKKQWPAHNLSFGGKAAPYYSNRQHFQDLPDGLCHNRPLLFPIVVGENVVLPGCLVVWLLPSSNQINHFLYLWQGLWPFLPPECPDKSLQCHQKTCRMV